MRKPRPPSWSLLSCGLALLCLSQSSVADEPQTRPAAAEPQSRPSLHTPAEILKIMEDSKLTYEVGTDENLPPPSPPEAPKALSDQMHLVPKEGGGYSLTTFTLSAPAQEKLTAAEEAYKAKDFDRALAGYQEVLKLDPDYDHALVLIGDVYFEKEGYETARYYYEQAIEKNFVDYQAHWFLADALWKLGDKKGAVEQITIAHLLNVGHATLRKVLLGYRQKVSRPWKDWQFSPRYSLAQDGMKVKIQAPVEWVVYAGVKAVWKYEPGYAERQVGSDYASRLITFEEEKEALAAYLAQEHPLPNLQPIVQDGFTDEFIYYEILAPKAPGVLLLLPREIFMRVVQYLDKYH